eukprot:g43676.t1
MAGCRERAEMVCISRDIDHIRRVQGACVSILWKELFSPSSWGYNPRFEEKAGSAEGNRSCFSRSAAQMADALVLAFQQWKGSFVDTVAITNDANEMLTLLKAELVKLEQIVAKTRTETPKVATKHITQKKPAPAPEEKEEEDYLFNFRPPAIIADLVPNRDRSASLVKEIRSRPVSELKEYFNINEDVVLGTGLTATVKLCTDKKTGEELAVKIINKLNSGIDLAQFNEEIRILGSMKHPNVINLRAVFEDEQSFYLITDLACGGELFDRLLERSHFTEEDGRLIISKLLNAIEYIHSLGVAHRDLKPENILFATMEEDSDVMISDFGFAMALDIPVTPRAPQGSDRPKKRQSFMMGQAGTTGYAAPEVFKTDEGYDMKCDMWSLGVIAYIMLAGVPPFVDLDSDGDDSFQRQPFWIYQNKMETVPEKSVEFPPVLWKSVSKNAQNFIGALLEMDPSKRLSAKMARKHPWILFSEANRPAAAERSESNLIEINREMLKKTNAALNNPALKTVIRNKGVIRGLDHTIKEKLKRKWDPRRAAAVQKWVEEITGTKAADQETLQSYLKNGLVLLNLMSKIAPDSIPGKSSKHTKIATAFHQQENIGNFLEACKQVGVREGDLFVTVDLFEDQNMEAVINTLGALATIAKKKGFQGPQLKNHVRQRSAINLDGLLVDDLPTTSPDDPIVTS